MKIQQVTSSGRDVHTGTIGDNRIADIEEIDITGSRANTLTLNVLEVLNISSRSNTLIVHRDADDTVNIGTGWTQQADEVIGSDTFEVFTQGAATLKVQALAPPLRVTEVKLSGSTWTGNFNDEADGEIVGTGLGQGYSIPTGGPAQTLASSWTRINRLIVTFTEPVDDTSVTANGNVVMHGINSTPIISLITVVGNQMIIDLSANLPTVALRLEIQDTVMSTAGEPLDGDFTNNSNTLPSGGTAGVGDPANNFNFQFITNPGDANRSGTVNISDAIIIFQNFFATAADAGYTIFADMTGDGILNISDAVIVFQNFFASPPSFPPPLFEPGSGFSSAPPVVSPASDRASAPTPASTAPGTASSSSRGQSAPVDPPSVPDTTGQQPDAELEVLDEVLSDSVGEVLTV